MRQITLIAAALIASSGLLIAEDLKELEKDLNHSTAYRRAATAGKLGKIKDDPAAVDLLLKRLKTETTDGVIVALLDALKAVGTVSKNVSDAAIAKLSSKTWQVVISAAAILSAQKEKESVAPLIAALQEAEKENNNRLMNALNEALSTTTGQEMFGAGAWTTWWDKNKDSFTPGANGNPPPKANETSITTFYEIPVISSRVLFVIDRSGSMRDKSSWIPSKDNAIETGANPAKAALYKKLGIPSAPDGDRKIDVVKYELMKAIADLPDGTMFDVIYYSDRVELISASMLKMNDSNRKKAVDWVKSLQPEGATNIYDALEKAFEFAGVRPAANAEAAKPKGGTYVDTDISRGGVDSIYFLSDGIANRGKILTTPEILAKIREINQVRKIAIHTVAVGGDADEMLMENLARENGGKYVKH